MSKKRQWIITISLVIIVIVACFIFKDRLLCTNKTSPNNKIKSENGMVLINGGDFKMGSSLGLADASNVHAVKLDSFYMDTHEVTQESFRKLMGYNPSKFHNPKSPVESVRWTEAVKYCNARSKSEGLTPAYDEKTWKCDFSVNGYTLPTEAQWEYACRAGSLNPRFFDGPDTRLKRYGWSRKNSGDKTHETGKLKPNNWGLYDMYGNVAEWCNDYYAADYYKVSPENNPTGPETGKARVIRGGSWKSREKYLNSYHRAKDDPASADICQGYPIYGFRCVRRIFK